MSNHMTDEEVDAKITCDRITEEMNNIREEVDRLIRRLCDLHHELQAPAKIVAEVFYRRHGRYQHD